MWFALKGDERLGRCATEECCGQPIYRLEAGGVGSNYCSGCYAAIKRKPESATPEQDRAAMNQPLGDLSGLRGF